MPDLRTIIDSLTTGNFSGPTPVQEPTVNYTDSRSLAQVALSRADMYSLKYSLVGAPVSPYENLSGNLVPEETPIKWLVGRYKCNQFVGDVLTQGGYEVPTFKMSDGSEHYVNAEMFPKMSRFFDYINELQDLRIGDVIVIDHAGTGEDSAHVEVVTARSGSRLRMTGAHFDGAYEKDYTALLNSLQRTDGPGAWVSNGKDIYLLRPKLKM